MERKKSNRTRIVGIRLTPEEYAKIEKKWRTSTCRKLSDYLRKVLFHKPIVTTYRDRSMDDFMAEMITLRKELNSMGNNFNQAVKRLHTLQKIDEFRSWLITYELERKVLFSKVDEIKKQIRKMAEKWLQ